MKPTELLDRAKVAADAIAQDERIGPEQRLLHLSSLSRRVSDHVVTLEESIEAPENGEVL